MTRKLLAGVSAVVFASLSATVAIAACAGHTAETVTPVQTADISSPSDSGTAEETKQD
jgi:hypothetical protein